MTTDAVTEAMARAIFSHLWGQHPDDFGPSYEHDEDLMLGAADAALEAAARVRPADDPGELERLTRERDEARQLNRDYLNTPVGTWIARAEAAEAVLKRLKSAIRAADATTRAYEGDAVLLIDGDKMEALRRMAGLRPGGGYGGQHS